jgi:hypothetical protein
VGNFVKCAEEAGELTIINSASQFLLLHTSTLLFTYFFLEGGKQITFDWDGMGKQSKDNSSCNTNERARITNSISFSSFTLSFPHSEFTWRRTP